MHFNGWKRFNLIWLSAIRWLVAVDGNRRLLRRLTTQIGTTEALFEQSTSSTTIDRIEPEVDKGVETHRAQTKPVANGEQNLWGRRLRVEVHVEVVEMQGEPTDGEYYHNKHEHAHCATLRGEMWVLLFGGHRTDSRSAPNVPSNLGVAETFTRKKESVKFSLFKNVSQR